MAEQQNNNRERVKEIVAGIEDNIQALFQSERYFDYLHTMSRFHNYSVNNTILIHMQMPNATRVAGFNKWKNQFGRHVKKGEKGITIIAPTPYKKKIEEMKRDPDTQAPVLDAEGKAIFEEKTVEIPMFRPVKVFDVSQTDGKPLPTLADNLVGDVQQYEIFMEALRRTSPVPITIKPLVQNMDGFFSLTKQSITIREGMSEVQTVCATIHEIAHSILHNREQDRLSAASGGQEPPAPKDRETEEVEAESISYTVSRYFNIDTESNSMGYIAQWSSDKNLKELKSSLETICKTSSELITEIDRHFAEICKERGVEQDAPQRQAAQEAPPKMVFKMEANPFTTCSEDRFFVQAYEETEKKTLIPRDVLFYGDAPQCLEVRDSLTDGTVTPQDVREQYIRDHPPQELTDSPERFAADLYSHIEALKENNISLLSVSMDLQAYFLDSIKQGKFENVRAVLRDTAELTGTPNSALMDRLEKLHDQWEAALTYQISPYFPNSGVDRAMIQLVSNGDGVQNVEDTIFTGTMAHCEELVQKLKEGAITAREVREMESDDWPAFTPPPQPDEALYLVDNSIYVHIQKTDEGIDYSIYDKESSRLMDGGQIEMDTPISLKAARSKVFVEQGIKPKVVEHVSLDVLESLSRAQLEALSAPEPAQAPHKDELIEHFLKEDEKLWDTVLDKYPMPDGSKTLESMEENGYYGGDLLAVSPEKATELFDRDFTLYAVTYDKPELVFDTSEIEDFKPGVLYAIPREEWEASPDFHQAVVDRVNRQEARETAFLHHAHDCFAIYQLRDGDETRDLRYEPLPGQGVDKKFYELAYTGELAPNDIGENMSATLENLFRRFNMDHPCDYHRPSMSVSDIVALKQDGVLSCHYVDRYAFTELHGFLPQDNPLRNAEMATEDDYNMVDGIINNGPKEGPSVAELEAQVRAGQTISLMDLANASHKEGGEKKSVRSKLRRQSDKQEQKRTAPKKSAGRDR